MSPDFAHFFVLILVGFFQLLILLRARQLFQQDDGLALKELEARFSRDIRQRANRGHSPDWLRYQSEMDRVFDFRDDRLRSLASAALALGLGGTILALCVNLGMQRWSGLNSFDAGFVLQSMGVSLLGSLSGVILNLIIVLIFLPRAEAQFAALAYDAHQRLYRISEEHLPQEAFTQTVKEELTHVRESLNIDFAKSFSEAIQGFPDVVVGLGSHITKLAEVVETQSRSASTAVEDLKVYAATVARSAKHLQPSAQRLADVSEILIQMPDQLKTVVESGRDDWLERIRSQQEQHLQQLLDIQKQVEQASLNRERQMLEGIRQLHAAVGEVRDAVARMPEQLASEVEKSAGKLGTRFGQEARDHTNEVKDHLEYRYTQVSEKIEHHEQEWRNNIGAVVGELLEKVSNQVYDGLVTEIKNTSQELREISRQLPVVAGDFGIAHASWAEAHKNALAGWQAVGTRTEQAATKLVDANGHLNVASGALDSSAQNLQRVAQVTESFEASLQAALKEITTQHLADFEPIRKEMVGLVEELEGGQKQFEDILDRQSEFIRNCIAHLMKGRKVATLEQKE